MSGALLMRAQARNNAWANHRLLNFCAGLSQAEFEQQRMGFFPSLRATLNHILIIDHFYVDALEGGTLGPAAWADREPCRDVASLQAAQSAVDDRLIAWCEALRDEEMGRIIEVQRGHRVQRERVDRLLLHLFQHQIHHRGQAHAMLGRAAPQLDEFYCWGEAHLRAPEFAALGWSEDDLWAERR
ncbi:DinB family protein [Roseococcus sp. SDR]|nr:DinB family protein [Roseococcus sp. SDR]MBV1846067.1 DinB family protein [Roseococcus sp. SDR]